MNKRDVIKKYAQSEDDILMLARVFDAQEISSSKNYLQNTRFLPQRDWTIADKTMKGEHISSYTLWGGYDDAERRIMIFYPDYLDESTAKDEAGIDLVRASFYTGGALSHRDMLGSLMNIGITRECIGDILVHDKFCDILCVSDISRFIVDNLVRAGHEALNLELLPLPPAAREDKTELHRDTVQSQRLDAVVAAAFSISRGKSSELIAASKVKVNDFECKKPDRLLTEGDIISARGFGKAKLNAVLGSSRKGRIIIEIVKYL